MTMGKERPGASWRRRGLVIATWLLVVALGSVLTFLVVDRAGRAVLDPSTASNSRLPEIVPEATSALTPTDPPITPTDVPTASSDAPGAPQTAEPAPTPAPAVPAPQPVQRTEGGIVAIACADTEVALNYATPATGWRMEVRDAGPAEVRVRFRLGDGVSESESEREGEVDVRGSCAGGVPTFEVERD
jgi:hypothetical protein